MLMACLACLGSVQAQEKLYPNAFPLEDVTLLDGPFKHAQDLNVEVLLQYDVDRLLAPFLKEAGLPKKAEVFSNWAGLDGHVGGHYLSALAIHYASTGNEECKRRMDYMLSELKRCQEKNGDGYIGGIPNGASLWNEIKKGNVEAIWKWWAPWYNLHKMYAGLRDAWLYADSEEARRMFLDYCDWGIGVISPLNDEQMEQMRGNTSVFGEEPRFSIRKDTPPKKTGIGYKVFYRGKDGKLYPPMVANPNGEPTPVGVWLDADAAPVVSMSKTGRPQVKAGGRGTQGGSGTLAYRPGWHLGTIPYAVQFNRKNPETGERTVIVTNDQFSTTLVDDKLYIITAESNASTDWQRVNTKYMIYDTQSATMETEDFITDGTEIPSSYYINVSPTDHSIYVTSSDYINTGDVYVYSNEGKQQDVIAVSGINPMCARFITE